MQKYIFGAAVCTALIVLGASFRAEAQVRTPIKCCSERYANQLNMCIRKRQQPAASCQSNHSAKLAACMNSGMYGPTVSRRC